MIKGLQVSALLKETDLKHFIINVELQNQLPLMAELFLSVEHLGIRGNIRKITKMIVKRKGSKKKTRMIQMKNEELGVQISPDKKIQSNSLDSQEVQEAEFFDEVVIEKNNSELISFPKVVPQVKKKSMQPVQPEKIEPFLKNKISSSPKGSPKGSQKGSPISSVQGSPKASSSKISSPKFSSSKPSSPKASAIPLKLNLQFNKIRRTATPIPVSKASDSSPKNSKTPKTPRTPISKQTSKSPKTPRTPLSKRSSKSPKTPRTPRTPRTPMTNPKTPLLVAVTRMNTAKSGAQSLNAINDALASYAKNRAGGTRDQNIQKLIEKYREKKFSTQKFGKNILVNGFIDEVDLKSSDKKVWLSEIEWSEEYLNQLDNEEEQDSEEGEEDPSEKSYDSDDEDVKSGKLEIMSHIYKGSMEMIPETKNEVDPDEHKDSSISDHSLADEQENPAAPVNFGMFRETEFETDKALSNYLQRNLNFKTKNLFRTQKEKPRINLKDRAHARLYKISEANGKEE